MFDQTLPSQLEAARGNVDRFQNLVEPYRRELEGQSRPCGGYGMPKPRCRKAASVASRTGISLGLSRSLAGWEQCGYWYFATLRLPPPVPVQAT